MADDYQEIQFALGSGIKEAVVRLQAIHELGQKAKGDFNTVMLYSDTVTMDGAFLAITGKTEKEFDAYLAADAEKTLQRAKEFEEQKPEWEQFYIWKGRAILDEPYWPLWDECVPIRLDDLYRGMELGMLLDLAEILNEGGSMEEAKALFSKQGHSGSSAHLLFSMLNAFVTRGPKLVELLND